MLEFIKKIFAEEEQPRQVLEMNITNIKDWVNEKAKPLQDDIRSDTEEVLMKVDEEVQKARYNLDILENAKLQNPNIPFKAKQYMEGNRSAYIRSVTSFLGHMEINNKEYHYLVEFSKNFDNLLDDLGKNTIRSYSILSEFFANEVNKIASNIKNFDLTFKELNLVLNDTRLTKINELLQKIELLETRSKQKINLDVDVKNSEANVKLANSEKETIMGSIESFNSSDDHTKFLKLKEEKKAKTTEFSKQQDRLNQSFSLLERPLRKYSHIAFSHEELVLSYLRNPIDSLSNDKNLEILNVLVNLERMLSENEIVVDDRKKEKSIDEIKSLNKEFFTNFLKGYYEYKDELNQIENKIDALGVSQKLKNFNRELEDANLRIERNTEEYLRLKEDHEKVISSFTSLLGEIKKSLKDVFNYEVNVII